MWVKCCRLMDYNMFDCLLTLCELCKDLPPLLRDLWQLLMLMLIPTQADLLQQSVERMCMDKESEEIGRPSSDSIINSTWTQILQSSSSAARTTYLLQCRSSITCCSLLRRCFWPPSCSSISRSR